MRAQKKRSQQQEGRQFPFSLIQFWFEPLPEHAAPQTCRCREHQAVYSAAHYMDTLGQLRKIAEGMSEEDAVNFTWNAARDEQMQGNHRLYVTTYHCLECVKNVIQAANGENVARLALLPQQISGRPQCFIMAFKLTSMEDNGSPFLVPVHYGIPFERALIDVRAGKAVDIHLKR